MSSRNEIKSQQNHNKSLLHSNKPKFKENIRENIYRDELRQDGIFSDKIPGDILEEIIEKIRIKARNEVMRQFKLLIISIIITLLMIFLFVNKVEKELRNRRSATTTMLIQD
ncbi:hypothetical protein [Gramella sp. MAR_2010_147]|uniref:hypothetical protein n=1 Tax=Gramella sp. MAR_2010_147 TaxID=1250205 RepID=UPI00087C3572|nr:hypothetical protein [Gramella sp. MAR_2010_147]SDS28896.1 hypothetical protein SAMN04488553_1913 [Gramella sp. MAR_2010_147]